VVCCTTAGAFEPVTFESNQYRPFEFESNLEASQVLVKNTQRDGWIKA